MTHKSTLLVAWPGKQPGSPRRSVAGALPLRLVLLVAAICVSSCDWTAHAARAETPRVLPAGKLPDDTRLGKLVDLNGYFPFTPGGSNEAWQARAAEVRHRILVASGLWPMPERTPVRATVHGEVDRDGYTVSRVFFESIPGLYVTGSLYRPKGRSGRLPAVLCPHGHWSGGRFHDHGAAGVAKEIASGAEKYQEGGRYPLQARCVQLARMGCLVFHYDMLGYADNAPLTLKTAHGFATQRAQLSRPDRWGLFSAPSELRLQSALGYQTLSSLRALDWLAARDDVDPKRIAITGASGGGTQTFILSAIDDRLAVSFPAVMVSTAMQGGCTCENATYLRIGTGNVEFAAMFAPRPLALTAANDWTREMPTKGIPELQRHFAMLGVPENFSGKHFNFGHNYNAVSRAMMYEWMNKHLKLGQQTPIVEKDYKPLTVEEMTVWNDEHPKPACDEAAEVALLRADDRASQKRIERLLPTDSKSLARYREVLGTALAVMIGRSLPSADEVEQETIGKSQRDGYMEFRAVVKNKTHGEAIPTMFLLPENYRNRVVLMIDPAGKSCLFADGSAPTPAVRTLLAAGFAVAGADLLYQGDFLADGRPLARSRVVDNPRQFAGYTLGYNHPLPAQRVHDILTLVAFVEHFRDQSKSISLVGRREAAAWVLAAGAVAGDAVERVAVDTEGFRFAGITDIRDVNLWPGMVKYGDVGALAALCAPRPLWLAGEGDTLARSPRAVYGAAGAEKKVSMYRGPADASTAAAVKWIIDGK